ncbi:MAG: hypothetical protein KF744_01920 [Taibaiella sp.]|nr:hypothetical protein [Taibaiella sp.]
MKKLLPLVVCCIMSTLCQAQKDTVFLDEDSKVTTDRTKYVYYRFVEERDGLYHVRDYHRNHVLQSTGSYLDREMNVEHGYFIIYDSAANKTMEGPYVNGKQDGDWVAYNRPCDDLFVDDSVHYVKGEGEGRSTKWEHSTQKLVAVGNMHNSMADGEWIVYYPSGQTRIIRHFRKDVDHGHYLEYEDSTGNLIIEGDFYNGIQVGTVYTYFRSGIRGDTSSIVVHFDSVDKRTLVIEFDSLTHRRARTVDFLYDKYEGKWIEYCEDTDLVSAIYTYKQSKKEGPFKSYPCYGDHYLESEGLYKNDQMEGKIRRYYPDGKLRMEEQYKEDMRTGETKEYFYDDNGVLERTEESILNPTLKETIYRNGQADSVNLYTEYGLLRSYKVKKQTKGK